MNPLAVVPPRLSKPLVWIIILNWNGLEDTLACLESLHQLESTRAEVRVLVIDNGSRGDPSAQIQRRFPKVLTRRLPENIGFAGGCNHGIALALESGADYVLLLNNDTIVDPGFLDPLVGYCLANPSAAIVAPLICYLDQPERVWFAGATINLALGYFQHRHLNHPISSVPQHPFPTDSVTGCCMLIAAPAIEAIGMFDARLFAYFEDSDLCLRARRQGFQVACVPQSVIWHKESASTRRDLSEGTTSPLKHYLVTRNRITMVLKHANLLERAVFFLFVNTATLLFFLLAFSVRRRWQKMAWFCRGMMHGVQQKFDYPG